MLKKLRKYIPLKLLIIHLVSLAFFCAFWVTNLYCSYQVGFSATQENSYFTIMFLSFFYFLPIAFVCLIIYLIVLCKCKTKAIPLRLLVAFSFLFIILISVLVPTGPAKGYYDYVKGNVDIEEIHDWLVKFENPEYEFMNEDGSKRGILVDTHWPEFVRTLNPSRGALIGESESKKYLRLCYGFGPGMSFGLCVMEEPMDVPEYGYEQRIELQDNAFVWIAD